MANEIFISYSSIKDLDGTISGFHANLENAIQQRTKSSVSVFLDKRDIRSGEDWQGNLSSALQESKVLLIILSPNWLDRKWCRNEYLYFKTLNKTKSIIPIKWIDTSVSDAENDPEKKKILEELDGLQQVNWINMKYETDYKSSVILRKSIGELADDIVNHLKGNFINKNQNENAFTAQLRAIKPTITIDSQDNDKKKKKNKLYLYLFGGAIFLLAIILSATFFVNPELSAEQKIEYDYHLESATWLREHGRTVEALDEYRKAYKIIGNDPTIKKDIEDLQNKIGGISK